MMLTVDNTLKCIALYKIRTNSILNHVKEKIYMGISLNMPWDLQARSNFKTSYVNSVGLIIEYLP